MLTPEQLKKVATECMVDAPPVIFPEKKDWSEHMIDAWTALDYFGDQVYGLAHMHAPPEEVTYYDELRYAFDYYDHSVEVYFEKEVPPTWRPNKEMIDAMYALGFHIVYWNFLDGTEIRGSEGRRHKLTQVPI